MKITPIKPPVADSETELLAPDSPAPDIDDMDRADVPTLSDEHSATSAEIFDKRAQFAAWVNKLAAKLGGVAS